MLQEAFYDFLLCVLDEERWKINVNYIEERDDVGLNFNLWTPVIPGAWLPSFSGDATIYPSRVG